MPQLHSNAPKPLFTHGTSRVYHGDCLDVVPKLGKYDFVFCDPPFNIGQDYEGYTDRLTPAEYGAAMRQWLGTAWNAVDDHGILALHGTDTQAILYLAAAEVFEFHTNRIAWIIWHYRFGECTRSNWIGMHCHCLLFCKGNDYTWNPDAVLVDSDRATVYNDPRVNDHENGGKRVPGTVWGIPSDGPHWGRVQGNNRERRPNHPNQLPEVYIARLLRAYTNPGDRVLDPQAGSDTTATVAAALGRRCDTVDISLPNCQSIAERLRKGAIRV